MRAAAIRQRAWVWCHSKFGESTKAAAGAKIDAPRALGVKKCIYATRVCVLRLRPIKAERENATHSITQKQNISLATQRTRLLINYPLSRAPSFY